MVRKSIANILLLIAVAAAAHAADIDITAFGAMGDGKTLNTISIQKAIDECNKLGGGRVIFPAGKYLSGTIVIKNNVTLQLNKDALLLGSINIEDYRNLDPFTDGLGIGVGWALVVAVDVKDIGI